MATMTEEEAVAKLQAQWDATTAHGESTVYL